jgi:SEC-C motif-containing protein
MKKSKISFCFCCSGSLYEECCQRYHLGENAPNALLLMRSRYCAYALGLTDYIIRTTHPMNSAYKEDRKAWKNEIEEFCKQTTFLKLEVLQFQEGDVAAVVLFTAYLKQNGRDATFTERSRFEKLNGVWLYLDGEMYQGALC